MPDKLNIYDEITVLGYKKYRKKGADQDSYYLSFCAHMEDFLGRDFAFEANICSITAAEYDLVQGLKPFTKVKGFLYRNGNILNARITGLA